MSSSLPPPRLPAAPSKAPAPRPSTTAPTAPTPRPSTTAPTAPASRPPTTAPTAPVPGTADPATILEGDTTSLNDIYGAANYWQRSTTVAAKGARVAALAPGSSSLPGKAVPGASGAGPGGAPVRTFGGAMTGLAAGMAKDMITASAAPNRR